MKSLQYILLLAFVFIQYPSNGQTLEDYGLEFHLRVDFMPLAVELDDNRLPIITIDSTGDTLLVDIGVTFEIKNYNDDTHEITISDFRVTNVLFYDKYNKMKYDGLIYPESYNIQPPAGIDINLRNTIFNRIETLFNEKKKQWTIYLGLQYSRKDMEDFATWVNYGTLYCLIVM